MTTRGAQWKEVVLPLNRFDTGARRWYLTPASIWIQQFPYTTALLHLHYSKPFIIMKTNNSQQILSTLSRNHRVFKRACAQVRLLNGRVDAAKVRYDRANARGRMAFRYNARLSIAVLESVRDMTWDFASTKCDQIENLQDEFLGGGRTRGRAPRDRDRRADGARGSRRVGPPGGSPPSSRVLVLIEQQNVLFRTHQSWRATIWFSLELPKTFVVPALISSFIALITCSRALMAAS